MKKCPYCNRDNEDNATRCEHCFAGLPADEKKQEQPKKAEKKNDKE